MPSTDIKPATSRAEIIEALAPLLRTMPSKGKVQDRMEGYFIALASFSRVEIEAGVRKFLAGECDGVKTEFVPPPPQLAQIVRESAGHQLAKANAETATKLYSYLRPNSKLLAKNITKNQVVEGRGGGIYPPGCIWCPGPLGDNQDFGDLYAPDPAWRGAWPVGEQRPQGQAPGEPDRYLARASLQKLRDFSEPAETYEPEMELIPPPTIHDYSTEPLDPPTPQLLKNLEDHAKMDAIEAEREAQYEKGVEE